MFILHPSERDSSTPLSDRLTPPEEYIPTRFNFELTNMYLKRVQTPAVHLTDNYFQSKYGKVNRLLIMMSDR